MTFPAVDRNAGDPDRIAVYHVRNDLTIDSLGFGGQDAYKQFPNMLKDLGPTRGDCMAIDAMTPRKLCRFLRDLYQNDIELFTNPLRRFLRSQPRTCRPFPSRVGSSLVISALGMISRTGF